MDDEDYPSEIHNALKSFDDAVKEVETSLNPLFEVSRADLTREMDPLDIVKMDLTAAYTVNSLYWCYLTAEGIDPKSHAIKQELDRIRTYMSKVKEIENRKNAPRLVKGAAERFVRGAMFDPQERKVTNEETSAANEETSATNEETSATNEESTTTDETADVRRSVKSKHKKSQRSEKRRSSSTDKLKKRKKSKKD